MKLFPHQQQVLDKTKDKHRVAYYLDMGLGKTFVGSEKLNQLNAKQNLVICQKSKIKDWIDHFKEHYDYSVFDLTKDLEKFLEYGGTSVGVINYDLVFRRKQLLDLKDFTLLLDESSQIQNHKAKRSKFILKMEPQNVILLSGTPVSGKYENLWTQSNLLGWPIKYNTFQKQYVNYKSLDIGGVKIPIVTGYKNVDRLKRKLRDHGAVFMKTEEVIDLPNQTFIDVMCDNTPEYRRFKRDKIISMGDDVLVGDRILKYRMYLKFLANQYNAKKIEALRDILESSNDRLIVFYSYNAELSQILSSTSREHISIINGKTKDLEAYNRYSDSLTCVQYQAGAMGLNLQKANKIIYFSPTESSELFEQSKKRIHRIGQSKPCFYYLLKTRNSIDEDIYKALAERRDYTNELFKESIR